MSFFCLKPFRISARCVGSGPSSLALQVSTRTLVRRVAGEPILLFTSVPWTKYSPPTAWRIVAKPQPSQDILALIWPRISLNPRTSQSFNSTQDSGSTATRQWTGFLREGCARWASPPHPARYRHEPGHEDRPCTPGPKQEPYWRRGARTPECVHGSPAWFSGRGPT